MSSRKAMVSDARSAILEFLAGIGIPCEPADLSGSDGFLPGIKLERGRLLVDAERLTYPGDLLHEAGHLAVAPAEVRGLMDESADIPGVDTSMLEWAAIPWSYAAALAVGIDPALVFHDGGYRGHSAGLLRTFALGAPIGVHLLEAAGMTAVGPRAQALGVEPYPHMLRWLRA